MLYFIKKTVSRELMVRVRFGFVSLMGSVRFEFYICFLHVSSSSVRFDSHLYLQSGFCHAMLCISAAVPSCGVCLSVMFVHCVETAKDTAIVAIGYISLSVSIFIDSI